MNDDAYRTATGQTQPDWEREQEIAAGAFLTDDEVTAKIREYGGEDAVAGFPMRLQPEGGHPGDKVFRVPVILPDGNFLAVAFSFGEASEDEMEDWKPRWRSVDGPMTREQLMILGRS